ncbi:ComEC/Rec2 family competence protein [Clostridium magnum]|uniref:Hydroxyacylglutathione hydrolase n=1 Tax=Clostridium magnum DSM 2767 TaxID=1121326 RepID=A0A161WSN7_9CLOT|nr:MBL fold metallo-hydrolase [Clostridium magnum]KZL89818.1 hydroxyacylglutathione hydrolase [Clostridium magnum DSM 2767]SHI69318.1 Metal-dependent hydrolase, beta-lactamase superfamily II [Clostridium magnum DSM 2767]
MRRRIIIVFVLIIIGISSTVSAKNDKYEVHFVDAGQSDCVLIKGKNKNYIIDTGAAYYTNRILEYLNSNGISKIDAIILTHYHDDHYDGLLKIIENKKVGLVLLPIHDSDMKDDLHKKILKNNTKVKFISEGWKIKQGKINLKAIGPIREDNKIENNNSIVIQGEIDGVKYLFAGDCEKQEEEDLISSEKLVECDILKVPHHSLNTSSSEEFLKILNPKIAVVTCDGVGTPDLKIIKRINENGSIVFRSDINGHIVVKNGFIKASRDGISIRVHH